MPSAKPAKHLSNLAPWARVRGESKSSKSRATSGAKLESIPLGDIAYALGLAVVQGARQAEAQSGVPFWILEGFLNSNVVLSFGTKAVKVSLSPREDRQSSDRISFLAERVAARGELARAEKTAKAGSGKKRGPGLSDEVQTVEAREEEDDSNVFPLFRKPAEPTPP